MGHGQASHIRAALTSLLSPQLIRRRASALGTIKRRRKVDPVALVYTLVLGFERGRERTLACLRRAYISATGTSLAASAFYNRFTPELAELMRHLCDHALSKLGRGGGKLHGILASFSKVFIADGSLVRLHDALAEHFPSVWTNHTKASAKLHLTIDGATRTPQIVRIAPGSSHDVSLLEPGPWCRDALLLVDLAYYDGKLFQRILAHGGHFLCRVKTDANFLISGASDPSWVGRRHRELVAASSGRSFDVQIEHVYRDIRARDWTKRRLSLRLIGLWHHDAQQHRIYITSASSDLLATESAGAVYAMRWEIELLFRELKRQLCIDDMPSGNLAAVQVLLYAALLALALGRDLERVLTSSQSPSPIRRCTTERWTTVLRAVAPMLLALLVGPPDYRSYLERLILQTLRREAPDPNRKRLSLRDRAAAGVLRRAAVGP